MLANRVGDALRKTSSSILVTSSVKMVLSLHCNIYFLYKTQRHLSTYSCNALRFTAENE